MSIINVPNPDVAALGSLGSFIQQLVFNKMDERKEEEKNAAIAELLSSFFGGQQQPQGGAPSFGSAPGMMQAQMGQAPQPQQPRSILDLYQAFYSDPRAGKHLSDLLPLLSNMAFGLNQDRGYGLDRDRFEYDKIKDDRSFGLDREKFDYNKGKDDRDFGLRETELMHGMRTDLVNAGINAKRADAMARYYAGILQNQQSTHNLSVRKYEDTLPGGPMHKVDAPSVTEPKPGDERVRTTNEIRDDVLAGKPVSMAEAELYVDDANIPQHERAAVIARITSQGNVDSWIESAEKEFGW